MGKNRVFESLNSVFNEKKYEYELFYYNSTKTFLGSLISNEKVSLSMCIKKV